MTTLFIHRDVYCCEVDGGAIFLDLRTNSYLGTPTATLSSLRHYVRGWPARKPPDEVSDGSTATDERTLDDLIARRLLTHTESEGHMPADTLTPVVASLGMRHREAASRDNGIGAAALFVRTWLATSVHLRRGQLRVMIDRAARANAALMHSSTQADTERCINLSLAYRRFRPWIYRAREKCLLDSLVLTTFLHAYSVPATLVLGVAPKPFAAHAWVQLGSIVLNDKAEHVQMYTPILAA